ncbi:antibiotic biosynthesis monooxygenase [Labilibaculum sp. DW002]|uniref:Antibiotic biosynthesis monooxygenase n=1 Tax=Paralabilibaculum antarcticum TaxID=2912572 RepID=A0ABT5VLZ9_9BACT|nr:MULTISPECIES: antibiotic biosynthesis monooxygenase [unclassified Labilibaculum]MBI9059482.1 antibiotic biosynthesis monooxygenase [Labilibaculum sp.]MDE5416454.1 antibiotic biosynthesis monooxygenase [Labilibaculum sp. DW002]
MIAKNIKPPYYAVIFSSERTKSDNDYEQMADSMMDLAKRQVGFLGVESARSELGITVSYWESIEAIKNWQKHPAHQIAQERGKADWYKSYAVRICKVESDYFFEK